MTEFTLNEIHEKNFTELVINKLKLEVIDFAKNTESRFIKIDKCPVCGNIHLKRFTTLWGLHYDQCQSCKTILTNPHPPEEQIIEFLNTSEAMRIWREEEPISISESREKMYLQRFNIIKDEISLLKKEPISILEIGGGRGELASKVCKINEVNHMYVVEPQELNIDSKNVTILRSSFDKLDIDLQVDMVVSFEVLEHLIDPSKFFKKVFTYLKPGGVLILTCPNGDSLEVNSLKENSAQLYFDHIRLYNPNSIEIILKNHNFINSRISTPGNLDVEILQESLQLINCNSLKSTLKFILENKERSKEFQNFLRDRMLSSHMRCIANKPG